jgi:pimeloyl-ACP methyl ester carboxylesterase
MKKRTKGTLPAVGLALLLMGLAAGLCFGKVYAAGPEATALLSGTEAVRTEAIRAGWRLDGPGETDALIFYPGARVAPEAYLPLLTTLAADGIDCFLVRMPLNMAFLNMNAAADIQAAYAYDSWYLGGHSLGGACAALYAARHPDRLSGLVLLAAYATKPLSEELRVLVLYGSEDWVLNRKALEKGRQYLPSAAVSEELPGGNHAQFGDYGPQKGDGAAALSRGEQTVWAVERIERMILGE